MSVNLSMFAGAGQQFFDNSGNVLSGGKIYTYLAGTTTPYPTYTTVSGATPHANPIVLDSSGRVSAGQIWLTDAVSYKFVLTKSDGTVIQTLDNITGAGSGILSQLSGSSGSSLVGFIQSGTGTVASTVQTKLRERISVKDFGAVGDGSTDDTAAIQAAINAVAVNANNGKLYVPAGNYKITSTITIDYAGPLVIEGDAGNTTSVSTGINYPGASRFINYTAGGTMFKLKNTVSVGINVTANVTFIDCGFRNDLNASNVAVDDQKGYDKTTFIRCGFTGGSKGYVATSSFNVKFEDCDFYNITYGVYCPSGVDTLNMTWWRCNFRYCGNSVYALGGNSFHFYNCLFEACTGHGLYLDGVYNSHFYSSHWEQNGGSTGTNYDLYVKGTGTKMLSLNGCTLTRDTVTNPSATQQIQIQVDYAARGFFTNNTFLSGTGGTAAVNWATPGGTKYVDLNNSYSGITIANSYNQGFAYTEGTWIPSFSGLTVVNGTGGATYSGNYIRIGNIVYFTARITVTGTCTTASTLGSTYINNIPFVPLQTDWQSCTAIDQNGSGSVLGQGIIRASGVNVIHTPTWAALNHNITISGSYMTVLAA